MITADSASPSDSPPTASVQSKMTTTITTGLKNKTTLVEILEDKSVGTTGKFKVWLWANLQFKTFVSYYVRCYN